MNHLAEERERGRIYWQEHKDEIRERRVRRAEESKEYRHNYYLAHREKSLAQNAMWQKANRTRRNAKKRQWRAANPDKQPHGKKHNREHYEKYGEKARGRLNARRRADPEKFYRQTREWVKKNPGKVAALVAKRRASFLRATPAWADLVAIQAVYEKAAFCGLTVDHIIPLQGKTVCGLHVENNLQLLSRSENSSKGNRYNGI